MHVGLVGSEKIGEHLLTTCFLHVPFLRILLVECTLLSLSCLVNWQSVQLLWVFLQWTGQTLLILMPMGFMVLKRNKGILYHTFL